jgi:hypothetical protein
MSCLGIKFNVVRIGFLLIAAACAVTSAPCEATAKHTKHGARRHNWSTEMQNALASTEPTPERYYGGPKSPMWRQ